MSTYELMMLAVIAGFNIASGLQFVPESAGPVIFFGIIGLGFVALVVAVVQILRGVW